MRFPVRRPPLRRLVAVIAAVAVAAVSAGAASSARTDTVTLTVLVRGTGGNVTVEEHQVARHAVAVVRDRFAADPDVVAAGVSARRAYGVTGAAVAAGDDPSWGWLRLGGDQLADVGDGAGIVVAVVDTGVDAAHPELSARVLPGTDYVSDGGDGRSDPNGHGTHVAGIIAAAADGTGTTGVAPAARILPVRVLDASGWGDDTDLALGIIWAADHGATIINVSVGDAVPSDLLAGSIDYAMNAGVLVVVAAGNHGMDGNTPSYPAAYARALAVTATDATDQVAAYANTGSYVDLAAPGTWISSTWPGGGYVTTSGTSMAAPFVAGTAALVAARTGMRGDTLAARLTAGATDLGDPGRDDRFGYGLVNPLAEIGKVPDPVPAGTGFGLPALPPMPDLTFPDLPGLPDLPALTPPPMPTLPGTPAGLPNPPRLTRPEQPNYTVGVGARARWDRGRVRVEITLSGPAALVSLQTVEVTAGASTHQGRTGRDGQVTVTIAADRRVTVVTVRVVAGTFPVAADAVTVTIGGRRTPATATPRPRID